MSHTRLQHIAQQKGRGGGGVEVVVFMISTAAIKYMAAPVILLKKAVAISGVLKCDVAWLS